MRVTREANARSTGVTDSIMSAGPPAMMASVPAAAPAVPPETGASIHRPPVASAQRRARERVSAGDKVEWSMRQGGGVAARASPCSPNATSSTAWPSPRHSSTTSTQSPRPAAWPATAPAAARGASFALERFQTETS